MRPPRPERDRTADRPAGATGRAAVWPPARFGVRSLPARRSCRRLASLRPRRRPARRASSWPASSSRAASVSEMLSQASASSSRALASSPASTGLSPMASTRPSTAALAASSSAATKPSTRRPPATFGSAWRAASVALNAFTTRALGTFAWISSAPDVSPVANPGCVGLERVGGVDDDLAVDRRRRCSEHVVDGRRTAPPARRRRRPRRPPGWTPPPGRPSASAAARAESPFAELTVTLCPAFAAAPLSALPTLPAPMIAMSMVDSPRGRVSVQQSKWFQPR